MSNYEFKIHFIAEALSKQKSSNSNLTNLKVSVRTLGNKDGSLRIRCQNKSLPLLPNRFVIEDEMPWRRAQGLITHRQAWCESWLCI